MTNTTPNTKDFSELTASQILSIPADEPGRLFSGVSEAVLKQEYHALLKLWHADLNHDPKADDVTIRIHELYATGKKHLETNDWRTPGEVMLEDERGRRYRLKYVKKFNFELGVAYISRTTVTYIVRPEHKALFTNAVDTITHLPFVDDKMRQALSPFLPRIKKSFTSKDGYILALEKDPDMVRLQDVLEEKGPIDAKHVAWILSTLHNLSCYLSTVGLTHNDIGPESYFISPAGHSGALLGGWWYAQSVGNAITALPDRTYDRAPDDVMRAGKTDPRVDLGLIRLTGRELLGDPAGIDIHKRKTIPGPMAEWLRLPTSGNAKEDYRVWGTNILKASFGPRRYVEMALSFSDIYAKGGATPEPK